MDNLEKYILDNREEFDVYEPSAELWNKIEKAAPKAKRTQLNNWFGVAWKAAAAVVIFLSAFYLRGYIDSMPKNMAENQTIGQQEIIIPELAEAEKFYNTEVQNKLQEVYQFAGNNQEIKTQVNTDMAELDSICNELKNDLKDNVDNEEVVNAMIQNYRLKLQILEDILSHLQNKNSNNAKNKKNGYEI